MGDWIFSWRDSGAIAPYRTLRGHYCWAFASTAALEAINFISKRPEPFKELSVQQIVDCYPHYVEPRTWGSVKKTLRWILNEGGHLYSAEDYPLTPGARGQCSIDGLEPAGAITGIGYVNGDEEKLRQIVQRQPVPVAIASHVMDFRVNRRDIIRLHQVGEGYERDHCVLITGFGREKGVKFWEIQNTWGQGYQEDGFFRVERAARAESNGVGGIAKKVYFPRIAGFGADEIPAIDPPHGFGF